LGVAAKSSAFYYTSVVVLTRSRRQPVSLCARVVISSSQRFDVAADVEFEIDASDRNDRPSQQHGAGQFFLRIGLANRLLDLSLGSDPDLLKNLRTLVLRASQSTVVLLSAFAENLPCCCA
jgi:hypothetical protein